MKTIKVLQVNKLYYPVIGGIENLMRDIAEGINEKTEDIQVDVLVCQEKGPYEEIFIDGVKVIKTTSFGVKYSLPLSPQFISVFRKICKDYDIIHFHMPFPIGDLALLLSGYKGKVVAWWHSDIIRQKKALLLYKPILNWFLKRTDLIIAATPNHITSSSFINDFSHKCRIIPFGIKIDDFLHLNDRIKATIEANHAMLQGRMCVLFVGRLVYYKGIDVLIKAMPNNNAILAIIGDGPLKESLIGLSKDLGVLDRTLFLGKLDKEQMIAWYHTCDIFAFPSVANSEAFGLVQLEAMICGKPVINTNLPTGVPCVSLHNETGFTVPVGDVEALSSAIQTLLEDPDLRKKFGDNAIQRVKTEFSREVMIEKVIAIYHELLRP